MEFAFSEIGNEFASVRIRIGEDHLVIEDADGPATIRLDPIEMQGLARSSNEELRVVVDPGSS